MNEDYRLDRVRGSLVGGAAGDALGYPVEFIPSYEDICQRYGKDGITRLDVNPWWTDEGKGKALISDDTQMTLITACGVLNSKGMGSAPLPSIEEAYKEWYYTQGGIRSKRYRRCWVGDVPRLNVKRAPGVTCMTALESVMRFREPDNDSKGCGGLMRIAPVPLYGLSQERIKDVDALNMIAAGAAGLTHRHPLGYIPAYVASHLIYRLGSEQHPTRDSFLAHLREGMDLVRSKTWSDDSGNDATADVDLLQALLDRAVELSDGDLPDHEAVALIGEGWVAEETLAIAVYCCCRHFDNFHQALVASVNHAGDSDSTGAVTGNILGAAVGYDAIPQCFKDGLELHDVILHVADDLYRGYTTRFTGSLD